MPEEILDTIEKNYQNYLKLIGLDESTMHPMQRFQLKHAFYSGIGSFMVFIQDNSQKLPQPEMTRSIDNMFSEVKEYLANARFHPETINQDILNHRKDVN